MTGAGYHSASLTFDAASLGMKTRSLRKYDYIDALRGFAIMGVVLFHAAQWVAPDSEALALAAYQGARGVQLFFIASALTLCLSLRSRGEAESSRLPAFFIRRFFRIAPMFYVAALFYTAYYGDAPRHWAPYGVEWWQLPLTLLFLNGWHPETVNTVVPGGWSVVAEVTFYLCLPMLYARLNTVWAVGWAILASLVLANLAAMGALGALAPLYPESLAYLTKSFVFFWFFAQLPVFLLGILMFHVLSREPAIDRRSALLLLLAAGFLFVALLEPGSYGNLLPEHFQYGLAFCLFILGLHVHPHPWLVNPFTIWIGRLSFSIYLVHFVVLDLLEAHAGFVSRLGGDMGFLLAFLILLASASLVSVSTYFLVEKPGIRLGARMVARL